MANKTFLDLDGLIKYDELVKSYIAINAAKKQDLTDEITRAKSAEEQLQNNINANVNAINTLNGTGEGSIQKTVDDAITNLIDGAPDTLDTLKEISDWITSDEAADTQIINRVSANETNISTLQQENINLKAYIDAQDQKYYDSMNAIMNARINALFLEKVEVTDAANLSTAISNLEEGQKIVLDVDEPVTEDLEIPENVYIDAQGATFSGNIKIDESSTIDNAVFTGKVTIG